MRWWRAAPAREPCMHRRCHLPHKCASPAGGISGLQCGETGCEGLSSGLCCKSLAARRHACEGRKEGEGACHAADASLWLQAVAGGSTESWMHVGLVQPSQHPAQHGERDTLSSLDALAEQLQSAIDETAGLTEGLLHPGAEHLSLLL